ncbi:glycosyltransferase involved in cell wall biosynthesis [Bacillus pakistanensis]|uniref:Glycosyltransferase involved in cell wall biosynthesis n=1 Tax=Rossellomorea pakistanensis TaxID=992288 RepID=A0ABS2ND46_9BACI|nr:glycosyltransferase family 4 protein [Bacillus pakistanensis]MBM7585765.1 glycosyltransferase involved in cell wall biosynthesis [Bacillus pakistanensis]
MRLIIFKYALLISLFIDSEPIQNRLFRAYIKNFKRFSDQKGFISITKRYNKTFILSKVVKRAVSIKPVERYYLLAQIHYVEGNLFKAAEELENIHSTPTELQSFKINVLYKLKKVKKLIELSQKVNLSEYLSTNQLEELQFFAYTKLDPDIANKFIDSIQVEILSEKYKDKINALIELKKSQSNNDFTNLEKINVKLKNSYTYDPLKNEIFLIHSLSRIESSPELYKNFIMELDDTIGSKKLYKFYEKTTWKKIYEGVRLANNENYNQALIYFTKAYDQGERSPLLRRLILDCFHNINSFKEIQETAYRRLFESKFIDFRDQTVLEVLKSNSHIVEMFKYYSISDLTRKELELLVKQVNSLNEKTKSILMNYLYGKIIKIEGKIPIGKETLFTILSSISEPKDRILLEGRWIIENQPNREAIDRLIGVEKVSRKALLKLSDIAYSMQQYSLSLILSERALVASPMNPMIFKRLVSIHHRLGNLEQKLFYLKKLKKITGNLLVNEYEIAIDELSLLEKNWTWAPNKKYTISSSNKVIHVLNKSMPEINGYTIRSREIVQHQLDLDIEPIVVTKLGWSTHEDSASKEYTIYDGIKHYRLHHKGIVLNTVPLSVYFDAYADEFAQFLKKVQPKLVHAASNFQNALPALMVANKYQIPSVYEVRGFWHDTTSSKIEGFDQSQRYQLHEKYELYCCHLADKVVAIGESLAKKLIDLGIPKEKISIVPNGVDSEYFSPIPKEEELNRKFKLKDKLVFGFIGSVTHYEGIDYAFKALRVLKDEGFSFHFILVGDGPALQDLKNLSRDLDLHGNITFVGRVPHTEVKKYYSIIDVFPFPRTKAKVCALVTPLKPFEVMAMGKLSIVSDIPALNEMVIEDENGLKFESENVESLYYCMKKAKYNLDIGRKAREWVIEHRDWNTLIKKYNKVYKLI